jgi:ABC-type multidrug transport system ATPase subunit
LILQQLKLIDIADRLIGEVSEKGALSPEQRKLVSIAIELVADPQVLLLDEATTSLDSVSARFVIKTAKQLAVDRPVLVTIHQPSRDLFDLFDWMLVLHKGRVAYFGQCSDFDQYCVENDLGVRNPDEMHLADFTLSAICSNHADSTKPNPADVYEKSNLFVETQRKIASYQNTAMEIDVANPHPSNSFCTQFLNLLWREILYMQRDAFSTCSRLAAVFCQGILLGLCSNAYVFDTGNLSCISLGSLFFQVQESPRSKFNLCFMVFHVKICNVLFNV